MLVRWMRRRDFPEVLKIGCKEIHHEDDLYDFMAKRYNIGLVVDQSPKIAEFGANYPVLGYALIQFGSSFIHVASIATHPDYQRTGVGSLLIKHIKDKLSPFKRYFAYTQVEETNLKTQLFLKKNGFVAKAILRYEHGEDYIMQYDCPNMHRFKHLLETQNEKYFS